MHRSFPHTVCNQTLWVTQERGLFWEEEKTLIIADMHLGKSGHFRKEGIAVPQQAYKADLQRLVHLLSVYKAERLIIAGDLTHSHANKELDLFIRWRSDFPVLTIDLVKGNHDILQDEWYTAAGIQVSDSFLRAGPFCFIHDKNMIPETDEEESNSYTFTGHMHPAIQIRGQGRQSLRFPCFYFGKKYGVLPAFSRFTGTYAVAPRKGESVYAITPSSLIRLP